MSKRKSGFYLQLSRSVFPQSNKESFSYDDLSPLSRWVYCCLNELEHRYTGADKKKGKAVDFFFHANKDLAELAGVSVRTVQKARAELVKSGLVKSWQMHWKDTATGKLSHKHVSAYRIPE